MSIEIRLKTPNKKVLAEILRAIANSIEVSANETITLNLEVVFNAS